MRNLLAIAILAILNSSAFAVIRTVSNDPANPAQFNSIQAALNASSHGDTIYVNGTQFWYGDAQINRRVVLIGAGYNVPNQLNLSTSVGAFSLFRDSGVNDASGTIITGFTFSCGIRLAGSSLPVSGVRIFRNSVAGGSCFPNVSISGSSSDWLIYNNIIRGLGFDASVTNSILQNNIITGGVFSSNQSSIIIDHNVFLNSGLSNIKFATITNNIFVRTSGNCIDGSVQFNTFNNNISILTTIGPTAPTNSFLGGPNTGAGNLVGVDPLFESVPDVNTYSSTANYRLRATSPGKNAGTDGTDLGIYGGPYPFPSGGAPGSGFDTSPLPPIPQVTSVNVQNSSLQPGAQLQVNVQARINN